LHARCLARKGVHMHEHALAAFAAASARADRDELRDVAAASRLRRAELLATRADTLGQAVAAAAEIDPARLRVRDELAWCRLQLAAPSRFVRANALAILEEIAS